VIWALLTFAVLVFITCFHLRGGNLGRYDAPPGQSFDTGHEPSDEHDAVVASLDVGIPTFAMHSCRELAGAADPSHLYRVLIRYFEFSQSPRI